MKVKGKCPTEKSRSRQVQEERAQQETKDDEDELWERKQKGMAVRSATQSGKKCHKHFF
jgi:hypothetical protein